MRHKALLMALSALVAFSALVPRERAAIRAQIDGELVILMRGDLWAYDESSGTLRQLTRWGYNQTPVIAPDGQRVAYASIAEIAVPALQRFGQLPSALPTNIWLWSLASGQATRIAQQPVNARFGTGMPDETYIRRGTPVWSPDGLRLAWIESVVVGAEVAHTLVIYDMLGNRVRANVPLQVDGLTDLFGFDTPRWDIALAVRASGLSGQTYTEALLFFNNDGQPINQVRLQDGGGAAILHYEWATLNAQPYIAALFSNNAWVLINPINGSRLNPPSLVERFSPRAPNAVSVYFLMATDGIGYRWRGVANGSEVLLPFSGLPEQLSIAASGLAIAWAAEDAVYILRGGKTRKIIGTERLAGDTRPMAVAWSYNAWRVQPEGILQLPTPQPVPECALATRLSIGLRARVTSFPPQANALNSQPARPSRDPRSVSLGTIPVGGTMTLLNGPVCNDGVLWWQVNYNGIIGWTGEGENGVYWLEPLAAANACPPLLPPRLRIGGAGRVTPGAPNALRTQPTVNNQISRVIGNIPGGQVFSVLNGPICADGYTWWQVNYQGMVGWTPEGEGATYWLEPIQ
ncbi:MAG: hypothetical protein CUN49_01845 [Candidatus Thermofonsia Clade 1 bacterium]|uniref:SH3b domain-containing protein n=1 Tax=Candidatus Thermofonsia Clade 1 bacterium TaxID=2364210 RepID=A0A2M8PHX3_9CHLR|nr:MAG: hypothetical protein CUN49_01845 [Candidatus Thermofonsia Clade 1 bacterium]